MQLSNNFYITQEYKDKGMIYVPLSLMNTNEFLIFLEFAANYGVDEVGFYLKDSNFNSHRFGKVLSTEYSGEDFSDIFLRRENSGSYMNAKVNYYVFNQKVLTALKNVNSFCDFKNYRLDCPSFFKDKKLILKMPDNNGGGVIDRDFYNGIISAFKNNSENNFSYVSEIFNDDFKRSFLKANYSKKQNTVILEVDSYKIFLDKVIRFENTFKDKDEGIVVIKMEFCQNAGGIFGKFGVKIHGIKRGIEGDILISANGLYAEKANLISVN